MKRIHQPLARLTIILLLVTGFASADTVSPTKLITRLELELSDTIRVKDKKVQLNLLVNMLAQTDATIEHYPEDPDLRAFRGVLHANLAGNKGGFAALKHAKLAKNLIESAVNIKPAVLNGQAYSVLGTLYYRVPGWPISYGSNKKAELNFNRSLDLKPKHIQVNFAYAEFLVDQKRYADSKQHLETALEAPLRLGREEKDLTFKKQIQTVLDTVNAKLALR